MADISTIKFENTIYNIKDNNAARASDLNNYLPLTGGIVNGDIRLKSLSQDSTTTTSGNQWGKRLFLCDKNNISLGQSETFVDKNGNVIYRQSAHRIVDGVDKWNQIDLNLENDGTASYRVSHPTAFLNAINAVNKAGDTLTGRLVLSSDGIETSDANGYITDQYGNLIHKSNNTSNYWGIISNDNTANFSVYYESGDISTKGNIVIKNTPNVSKLIFKNPSKTNRGAAVSYAEGAYTSRLYFYQFKSNDTNFDLFKLPQTTVSETTNKEYEILTSKDIKFETYAPSNVEIPSGTNTNLASLTLSKGIYLIKAMVYFEANSNGRRRLFVSNSNAGNAIGVEFTEEKLAISNVGTYVHLTSLFYPSSNTTYYWVGYQNSGSNLSGTTRIRYIKIY